MEGGEKGVIQWRREGREVNERRREGGGGDKGECGGEKGERGGEKVGR